MSAPTILVLGGATRPGSSAERVAEHVAALLTEHGAEVEALVGDALQVPMYAPHIAERDGRAERLVAAARRADGVVLVTPSYHGVMSGFVKNALDYIEDLSGDPRPYFDGLPIGCVAVAHGWQGAGSALQSLRSIAHALRGWPTPLGVMLNVGGPDGQGPVADWPSAAQLDVLAEQVVSFARRTRQEG